MKKFDLKILLIQMKVFLFMFHIVKMKNYRPISSFDVFMESCTSAKLFWS
jgi:hypothetical protein